MQTITIFEWLAGGGAFALTGGALLFAFWFGGRRERWDTAAREIKEVKNDIIEIKRDITEMKKEISVINEFIRLIRPHILSIIDIEGRSPLRLSEHGQETARKIRAHDLARKYVGKVQIAPDFNAYEIQETCLAFCREKLLQSLTRDEKDELQNAAYENGADLNHYLRIISLVMRDIILTKKGMAPGKADAHHSEKPAEEPAGASSGAS